MVFPNRQRKIYLKIKKVGLGHSAVLRALPHFASPKFAFANFIYPQTVRQNVVRNLGGSHEKGHY
jgi:hypothetical protein